MRQFGRLSRALVLAFGIFGATGAALSPVDAWAGSSWVEVGEAPTTDLALTLRAIQSAQKSLKVNAYELTSVPIANAIRERILAGVRVDLLVEGEPVPRFPDSGVPIRNALVSAVQRMGAGSYREMEGRKDGVRRFVYDHAKYMIVDDSSVLMGSENYSPTGHPEAGAVGNRGWEVLVHDPALATDMGTVFSADRNKSHKDVREYIGFPKQVSWFLATPDGSSYTGQTQHWAFTAPIQPLPATQITPVVSPDTSLSALVSLIRAARRSIDIQQLNFDTDWDKQTNASPLLAEVVAAARRGVQVRVLLNDDAAFGGDPESSKNAQTVALLNQYATQYRLKLAGKIANLKGMGVDYIHNKGVLVDGTLTLVSSINWGQNSVERNRESGIVFTSPQINQHYSALFTSDWSK
jgi:phosphatidylserine/phosphatidylglycerophosphate/cardiolipin synthase-like enzyme